MRSRVSLSTDPRLRLAALLLGGCALTPGCGHRPVAEAPPQAPRAGQVPRAFVYAAPPAGVMGTPAPPEEEKEPEPTVGYPSLQVACDSVEALIKRRLHVAVTRADAVPVDFGFGGPTRTGCELKATGKFAPPVPDSSGALVQATNESGDLAGALERAGWAPTLRYSADGPDGEVQGWRSRESLCVVRWSWDGGDDSDSTYVPSDDWDLVVGCTRWEPSDSLRQ